MKQVRLNNCLLTQIDYGRTRPCENCLCQRTTQRAFWKIWEGVCKWLNGRFAHTFQNAPPPLLRYSAPSRPLILILPSVTQVDVGLTKNLVSGLGDLKMKTQLWELNCSTLCCSVPSNKYKNGPHCSWHGSSKGYQHHHNVCCHIRWKINIQTAPIELRNRRKHK